MAKTPDLIPDVDITEVITKSALVRSRIPGVEYVINPYTGCGHGCQYCYAVFMGKYSKQHQSAPWGKNTRPCAFRATGLSPRTRLQHGPF